MRKLKDPMGRIGNLLNKLQDCDYNMVYQPGAIHFTPDLLSRPSRENEVEIKAVEMQFESCVNWPEEQATDTRIANVLRVLAAANVEDKESWLEFQDGIEWFKIRHELRVQNGTLYREIDEKLRVVVPKQVVSMVLNFLHDSPLAGHRDFEKTYDSIRSKYFWLRMHKDIKKYCETCHLCQTKKYLNKPSVAPLKPLVVNSVWSLIGLDIAGPLNVTSSGNKYIVIAVDYFTKFCVAKAIPDFTALSTAKFLFEEVICKLGMPKTIISDKGVNFQSKLFEQLCKLLKIKKANSTFYNPEGVGMVERMVKTIKQIITMYVDASHTNWAEFLQSSIAVYNMSKQSSLKLTPCEALFAREAIKLSDVMLNSPVVLEESCNVDEYVKNLKSNASKIHNKIKENLSIAHSVQKRYYDQAVQNSRKYKIGDLVSVVNERSIVGQSKAFKDRLLGPFRIVGKFNGELNYKILNLMDNKSNTIHYNRLIPYKQRDPGEFMIHRSFNSTRKVNSDDSREMCVQNAFDFDIDFNLAMQEEEVASSLNHNCLLCGQEFSTNRKLLQHLNEAHEEVTLGCLSEVFETDVESEFDFECCTEDSNTSQVSEREILARAEYVENEELSDNFMCELCGNDLKSRNKLNRHMNTVHNEVFIQHVNEAIDFVVNDGVPEDLSESLIVTDVTINSNEDTDLETSDNESNDTSVDVVVKSKRVRYVNCEVCGGRFKKTGLHVHMRVHARVDVVEENGISSSVEGDVNGSDLAETA